MLRSAVVFVLFTMSSACSIGPGLLSPEQVEALSDSGVLLTRLNDGNVLCVVQQGLQHGPEGSTRWLLLTDEGVFIEVVLAPRNGGEAGPLDQREKGGLGPVCWDWWRRGQSPSQLWMLSSGEHHGQWGHSYGVHGGPRGSPWVVPSSEESSEVPTKSLAGAL